MTYFKHTQNHNLNCSCDYCNDVDPNKSIARELERYIEELIIYSANNLNDEHFDYIHKILNKICLMRRYFPSKELPIKHQQLIDSLDK